MMNYTRAEFEQALTLRSFILHPTNDGCEHQPYVVDNKALLPYRLFQYEVLGVCLYL